MWNAREPGLLPPRARSLYCTLRVRSGEIIRRDKRDVCVCVRRTMRQESSSLPPKPLLHSLCLWAISARTWVEKVGFSVEMASWTDINTLPSAHWPRACANSQLRDGHVTRRAKQEQGDPPSKGQFAALVNFCGESEWIPH